MLGPLPTLEDDPVRRLVAVWLLGNASPATRCAYAADITAWLALCGRVGTGPLEARGIHVDSWARPLQTDGASPRDVQDYAGHKDLGRSALAG